MRSTILWSFLGCWMVTVAHSQAAAILQDSYNAAIQVDYYEPIAQSFTAEDPHVLFAYHYEVFNETYANDPLQIRLLTGDGLGGSELATVGFSLADDFDGYFDVDLSAATLTPGQVYTAELIVPGDSPYWGVRLSNDLDLYSGGRAYFTDKGGNLTPDASDDMRFRITPIPEPSTLLGVGLLVGFGWCRKRG